MELDTIVAIATPPGRGALGMVRLTGSGSHALVNKLTLRRSGFRSRMATWTRLHGQDGAVIDEGVVTTFDGPRSYSGEDMAEITCHGSPLIIDRIVDTLLGFGGRPARPGEFTLRAFMNGRLDLPQAEAVLELVNARTDAGLTLALQQMHKELSTRVTQARSELLDVLAHITALVDFSEEDIAPVIGEQVLADLSKVNRQLDELLSGARQGEVLQHGISLVIVGAPNVGKSSILNGLLGRSRAIVTPIAGTTRDTLEEEIQLDRILFHLTDTAGIRESVDAIEMMGVRRSQEAMSAADMVLLVIDGSRRLSEDDRLIITALQTRSSPSVVVAVNKSDLATQVLHPEVGEMFPNGVIVRTSAIMTTGLDDLRTKLPEIALQGPTPDGFVVSSQRHIQALRQASSAVRQSIEGQTQGIPLDLVGLDIRSAVDSLSEILGIGVSEELLDRIFSRFCIGK